LVGLWVADEKKKKRSRGATTTRTTAGDWKAAPVGERKTFGGRKIWDGRVSASVATEEGLSKKIKEKGDGNWSVRSFYFFLKLWSFSFLFIFFFFGVGRVEKERR
jgi:hypothetical protein